MISKQVSPTGRYGEKFICPPNSTIKTCRWGVIWSINMAVMVGGVVVVVVVVAIPVTRVTDMVWRRLNLIL